MTNVLYSRNVLYMTSTHTTDLVVGDIITRSAIAGYSTGEVLTTETVEVVAIDLTKDVALGVVRTTTDPKGNGIGRNVAVFFTAEVRAEADAMILARFEKSNR